MALSKNGDVIFNGIMTSRSVRETPLTLMVFPDRLKPLSRSCLTEFKFKFVGGQFLSHLGFYSTPIVMVTKCLQTVSKELL